MKLRVGVVGLGSAWESRHRPALRALADRFEVRAVCDPVAHRAALTAHDFAAVPMDGYRALAARQDIDAVIYLSSRWYGPQPILAACDAGKSVYCAATVDIDPGYAEEIRARVEQSGISFVAEYPYRHCPATLRLKELIATNLGQPRLLFCHKRQPAGGANGEAEQAATRELVQLVDWCRYIVGYEPTSVFGMAHAACAPAEAFDYQMMSLDFSRSGALGSGPVAQISCGRYIPPTWHEALGFRPPAAMQVACERGIAFVDLPTGVTWFDEAGRHLESLESERPVGEQLLIAFYRAATSLVRSTSSFDDAYRSQNIVARARACFSSGGRQSLTDLGEMGGRHS